jgi:hypothetical protein
MSAAVGASLWRSGLQTVALSLPSRNRALIGFGAQEILSRALVVAPTVSLATGSDARLTLMSDLTIQSN